MFYPGSTSLELAPIPLVGKREPNDPDSFDFDLADGQTATADFQVEQKAHSAA